MQNLQLLKQVIISSFTVLHGSLWPAGSNKIILTFDDGPNSFYRISERLLDVLSLRKIAATFCYIGKNIIKASDTVRRAHQEGHQLAIHTYSHAIPALISVNRMDQEIKETTQQIRNAIGDQTYNPVYFRPPFGIVTSAVKNSIERNQMKLAYITFYINDAFTEKGSWKRKIVKIKKKLVQHQGGAIVLHEMCYREGQENSIDKSWLPQAVDELIIWANDQGFTFELYDTNES